jgi:hypothetical protein
MAAAFRKAVLHGIIPFVVETLTRFNDLLFFAGFGEFSNEAAAHCAIEFQKEESGCKDSGLRLQRIQKAANICRRDGFHSFRLVQQREDMLSDFVCVPILPSSGTFIKCINYAAIGKPY